MCLIVVAIDLHPEYPLMIVANRDEFFARPTAPAQYWPDLPTVLAGRDLDQGGTWMGITREGRFAAVTNFRDGGRRAGRKSRGWLVRDFLAGDEEPAGYLARIDADHDAYDGFNLIVGNGHALAYYSNRNRQVTALASGVYGLSNHLLDTPWPKVERAKDALRGLRNIPAEDLEDALAQLLADDARAPDEVLPRTGVSLEWERVLSSAFISTPEYGTRASTLVLRARTGQTVFRESSFGPDGQPVDTRRFVIER
jgi:uncharacterized protein with NRDE domain